MPLAAVPDGERFVWRGAVWVQARHAADLPLGAFPYAHTRVIVSRKSGIAAAYLKRARARE